jgi:hypothetical protein
MNKQEKMEYKDKQPVAVYPMSNWGGIEILDILYGIDDSVVYRFNFGEPQEVHRAKINYGVNHSSFRTTAGYSVRLDECMRV